ncbi:MAG: hydrolase [Gammaproteobacteria bacterium]|nr:hydrolase [Gammaproteobacteria bacterium]
MIKNSNFKPAWWLSSPHLQTLWPVLFWAKKKPALLRQRLELPDGDFMDVDWVNQHLDAPIVVILHGLEGSCESHYARDMLYLWQQLGYRAVLMHFRGCSGEINRTARYYHSGDTGDLAWLVQNLQKHYPNTPLAAIGYSLGGNVLLKWLGETGTDNPLSCAVAVSVPLCLNKSADRMQQGFSRFYQWYLIKQLRHKLKQKHLQTGIAIDVDINSLKDFWSFDDKVTAPLHGFKNAEEYYTKSSSRQYLAAIAIPALILHAEDDPFMDPTVIPRDSELSSQITFELSERGGHVGFISGTIPGFGQSWLLQRVPDFVRQYLVKG